MKRLLIIVAVIGLTASLGAQSLVDLAKREKERRAAFKGRQAVVVTNHDLMKVKKLSGVEVGLPAEDVGEAGATGDQGVEPATVSGEEDAAVPPSGSGAPARRINPRVSAPGPTLMGDNANDQAGSRSPLEAQLKAAQELVDLLTTKMNALRQQFESQDAMVPGYVIQEQLAETNQRLVKAQAQESRIRAEMDKKGLGRKAPDSVDR